MTLLEPCYHCMLELEGHRGNGTLYDLLPTIDYLLAHLKTAKHSYTACNSTPNLVISIQLAWQKLDK